MKKPSVFLVRKMALGDVLWIEPVIRQLASLHEKVVVYTRYPELFCNYPLANVRFTNRLRWTEKLRRFVGKTLPFTRIHIGLDRAYEKNPRVHILTAYQQAAGLPLTREYPRLYLSQAEQQFRPAAAGPGKYVVLHLESFAAENFRRVHGVDWPRIVSCLSEQGFTVIQTGKEPVPIPGAMAVTGTIRDLIALIRGAAFFIGLDSGPSHIAAALGVPALIFFGAVNPDFRHFRDLLQGEILQQPCGCAGWYHETDQKRRGCCMLVGAAAAPQCALHTTAFVWEKIESLIRQYGLAGRLDLDQQILPTNVGLQK